MQRLLICLTIERFMSNSFPFPHSQDSVCLQVSPFKATALKLTNVVGGCAR